MDMYAQSDASLLRLIDRIVSLPLDEEKPFIIGGPSYRDVYALGRSLAVRSPGDSKSRGAVLVTASDRARVAAAVLSALAGGPDAVLPHSSSPRVLEDLRRSLDFEAVLEDGQEASEGGHVPRWFGGGGCGVERAVLNRALDEPFVRLFTGGSTGRPRVWDKSPRNLIGEAAFLADRFGIGPDDIILASVAPQHIYGLLLSVLVPLVTGASVVRGMPCFHGEILADMGAFGATVFVGAPAHYRVLRGRTFSIPTLRLAFSSGGFLPEEDSRWFSSETGVGVEEVYGSTETGGIATRCRLKGEQGWTRFGCVEVRIRDERLCVRSPFLSRGLTLDQDGYFTTGDMAAAGPGGAFDLKGRVDGVVKVAGRRVELADVESRIKGLGFVRDAFVFALPSGTMRSAEIVCLIVPEDDGDRRDLRARLSPALSSVEMPRRIRSVSEIPLTPAGKPDREAATQLFEIEGETPS